MVIKRPADIIEAATMVNNHYGKQSLKHKYDSEEDTSTTLRAYRRLHLFSRLGGLRRLREQ